MADMVWTDDKVAQGVHRDDAYATVQLPPLLLLPLSASTGQSTTGRRATVQLPPLLFEPESDSTGASA